MPMGLLPGVLTHSPVMETLSKMAVVVHDHVKTPMFILPLPTKVPFGARSLQAPHCGGGIGGTSPLWSCRSRITMTPTAAPTPADIVASSMLPHMQQRRLLGEQSRRGLVTAGVISGSVVVMAAGPGAAPAPGANYSAPVTS